ncbi:MAG TPA: hypothetical protein PLL30_15285 [Candidatus Krumholzibacteria bacterium]|nr:hypothetical protein [Candidatus Krumholzibacteria bacterium]HPD73134.1 hypothetical protein [Candidatus Krumholzibacteria bacterium]HRY41988.1 hypothetical protein [Candidatus Krumholzibacteria bacterium]
MKPTMRIVTTFFLVVPTLLVAHPRLAEAAATAAPDWVLQRPDLVDAYWGIGQVAFADSLPTGEEKQVAYGYAAAELSAMIGQRIVASFSSFKQETGVGPDAPLEEKTIATIERFSRTSLSGVRIREEWVDTRGKRYHVLLVIGLAEANRQMEAWAEHEEAILREVVEVGIRQIEDRLKQVESRVGDQDARIEGLQQSISTLFTEMEASKDKIEVLESGEFNWSRKLIRASGIGVPNEDLPAGVQRQSAVRAAQLDAKNNLLKLVDTFEVESKVLMRDGVLESSVIVERMRGRIRGAHQVGETVFQPDGTAEVIMEVDVREVFSD